MKVSVVIPFYNEEENIAQLAEELSAVADKYDEFEAVFVDDGSSDNTWSEITKYGRKFSLITPLQMPVNSGQSAAMLAGLNCATGDVMVTMDGDLQNDPADIPKLTDIMAETDVVCGYRGNRKDSRSKLIASRIGNTVRNWFTKDGAQDTGCSLKAFKQECVADLPPVDGVHRFMPAYFKLHDRAVKEVCVNHRNRIHGESKYTNLKRLPRTLFDLVGFCWYRKRLIHSQQTPASSQSSKRIHSK